MKTHPLASASPFSLQAPKSDSPDIDKAARGFESLFAQTMIKTMREASFGDPLSAGDNNYRDLYDRHLADRLSEGRGLGLAQLLRRQLSTATQEGDAGATTAEGVRWFNLQEATAEPALHPGTTSTAQRSTANGASVKLLDERSPRWMLAQLETAKHSDQNTLREPIVGADVDDASTDLRSSPSVSSGCTSVGFSPASAAALPQSTAQMTPEQFVSAIWPHAQAAAAKLGVCPRTLVAQAALETGWGRHMIRRDDGSMSNNLFGIKAGSAWKGETLQRTTREFHAGVEQAESAKFRGYDSLEQSFEDYSALLSRSPRYSAAVAAGMDGAEFARALQAAGYATDPQYAAKISAIAEGPTLRRALGAIAQPQIASL